ncbi:hypothetical protein DSECCO2_392950 [anaerobic digester metagenome]
MFAIIRARNMKATKKGPCIWNALQKHALMEIVEQGVHFNFLKCKISATFDRLKKINKFL